MAESIHVDRQGAAVTITINRPERQNALTAGMVADLGTTFDELRRYEGIAVLVLRGAGEHFSVGRDDSSLGEQLTYPAHRLRQAYERIRRVNLTLSTFPAITIAAIRGQALGAACGLACQCDIVLAAEDAQLGFPEIDRGLPPTIVMSYLGRLLQRRAAFELVVTGRHVGAEEAVRLGLATRTVPVADFDAELARTVHLLTGKSTYALHRCKEFWTEIRDLTPEEAGRYAISTLAILMGTDEVGSRVRRSIGESE